MAKVALLIGISEYSDVLPRLPGTEADIQNMKRVLENPGIGRFDEVRILPNPTRSQMEREIERFFTENRSDNDLVLLYFAGHGIKDDDALYFAACNTEKDAQGYILTSTAVSASALKRYMRKSHSKRQVLILDCCFSGAFANDMSMRASEIVDINVKDQLGGEGRVVLTSSTATQVSYEREDGGIYTLHLVRGLETGAADQDKDGRISIDELHEYAKKEVQTAAPAMKPEIYVVGEGYKIWLADAPRDNPILSFRRLLEERAAIKRGKFSDTDLIAFEEWQFELGISSQDAELIKSEILQPYEIFWSKLARFEREVQRVIERELQTSSESRDDLEFLQRALKLRDEDVASVLSRLGSLPLDQRRTGSELLGSNLNWQNSSKKILKILVIVAVVLLGGIISWSYRTEISSTFEQLLKNSGDIDSGDPSPTYSLEPVQYLISAGENGNLYGSRSRSLNTRYRDQLALAIEKFKAAEYGEALGIFKEKIRADGQKNATSDSQKEDPQKDPRKDPEVLIFENNSKARLNHQNGKPIYTIAAAVPLSDANGEPFNIGQQILLGVAQAQSEALEDDKNPINLEVVIANDRNSPAQAEELAKELSKESVPGSDGQQREIIAVVGHYTSEVTCAALKFYNDAGLALISSTSTRVDLRSACDGEKVFFRTVSSTKFEAESLANYLVERSGINNPKIAAFYKDGSGFSEGLLSAFKDELARKGALQRS